MPELLTNEGGPGLAKNSKKSRQRKRKYNFFLLLIFLSVGYKPEGICQQLPKTMVSMRPKAECCW